MKKAPAAFATPFLYGLLLLARTPFVSAQTGTITESYKGIDYVIDRYDVNGVPSYEVSFDDSGFTSTYEIDRRGFVTTIYAGTESYRMSYRPNNDKLRNVFRLSSRRQLEEGHDSADVAHVDETVRSTLGVAGETASALGARRRLLICDECVKTWETVCDNGVDTVCALKGFGSPILSSGEVSIGVFCKDFGAVCRQHTADKVCEDECRVIEPSKCLPPLTITLEYEKLEGSAYSSSESDSNFLDLFVVEPGGQTAYWGNGETDTGRLVRRIFDRSITYTMRSGLGVDGPTGQFVTFVEWNSGRGPIAWTVTAVAGNGEVLLRREGVFTEDICESTTSRLMYGDLGEYVDNRC